MGPYLVLPVFGPSSVRDGIGFALDWSADPLREIASDGQAQQCGRCCAWSTPAPSLLKASDVIDGVALDKYLFIRDTYLQRRRNLVYDGDGAAGLRQRRSEPRHRAARRGDRR